MSVNVIRAALKGAATAGAIAVALAVADAGLTVAARPAARPAQDLGPGPVRSEAALEANAEAVLLSKAGEVKNALDFPSGKSQRARHVKDGFTRAEFDEVTETDEAGGVLSITQFDSRGVRFALRLDDPGRSSTRVSQDAALKAAQRAAGRLGISWRSVASVDSDAIGGGWTVRCARTSNGVRVRGDEVRVGVRPDGKIGSLARVEHDLAAAPQQPMRKELALGVATTTLDGWFAQSRSRYEVQSMDLEWVDPNGLFDSAGADTAGGPYRQAWVVTVKPSGAAAEYVRLLALYVDAADGQVIGGDSVE